MGDAKAISAVADVLMNISDERVAIVSATSGTTDTLIELGEQALAGSEWEQTLQALIDKHQGIIEDLELDLNLGGFWEETRNLLKGVSLILELSLSAKDRLLSFGERVSSTILAGLLEKRGFSTRAVDAHCFIHTDNNFGEGNVVFEKTNSATRETLLPLLESGIIPVVTGFIAQAENGRYITLGRGGSDYTAAILASALDARELQIWTDVDGIYNTDPRLVPEAHVLPQLSFYEASELAYFGAKVLHPKTIRPAVNKNIPVRILNTFNTGAPGTLITNNEEESIKSVTYRGGVTIINICSGGMLEAHGFLAKIFEVFARHSVIVDVVSTSEVSVSLTVNSTVSQEVLDELSAFSNVSIYENMAIVCLVGNGIRTNAGILGNLFSSLTDYNIGMVSQGASRRNVTFLVNENEVSQVVRNVFQKFFLNPQKNEH